MEGQKRESIEIIADTVQFLGARDGGNGATVPTGAGRPADESDVPIDTGDFDIAPAAAGSAGEDDIPF